MSTICDNTTPLGSKNADETLNVTSSALADAILDLSTLANTTNPLDSVDRNAIINLTNGINNVLINTPLDDFPSLANKVAQDGRITPTDIAQFTLDNNTDVTELQKVLDDYNTGLPTSSSTTDTNIGSTTGTGTGDGATGTGTGTGIGTGSGAGGTGTGTGTGVGGSDTSGIPTIDTGSGDTSILGGDTSNISTSGGPGPFGQQQTFSTDDGLSRTELLSVLGGSSTILPVLLYRTFKALDFQFAINIGQELTASACGAYNDVLADLTKAFAVVKAGRTQIDQLTNLLEKDPLKLIESIKQRSVLESLMQILQNVIESVVNQAKNLALAAAGSVLVALKGMESAASAIMKKLNKTMQQINDYLEDASVKSILADMEALITNLAGQFERLTPQNIANVMFRLCQIAQDLQAKLMAPALKLNKMANSVGSNAKALKSQSAENTKQAVKYGAIRVSEETRRDKLKKVEDTYKGVSPSNRNADFITRPNPSEEENNAIFGLSESGLGTNITFSEPVKTSKGWKEIDSSVWARLLRVVAQTGESYEVKQAFVPRADKDTVGGNSMNSHNSGFAIDIFVTTKNRDDTVVAASRAGFTGIGIYTGHLHLDLGPRRGWQKGFSGADLTINQLLLDEHAIDSFKKKRL